MKLKLRRPRIRLPHHVSVGTHSITWSPTRMFGLSIRRKNGARR
jgi:hypothetical protein